MKYQHLFIFYVRYIYKMISHTFKMYCYFSVRFNDISENRKIKIIVKLKIKMVHTTLIEKYFLKQ